MTFGPNTNAEFANRPTGDDDLKILNEVNAFAIARVAGIV